MSLFIVVESSAVSEEVEIVGQPTPQPEESKPEGIDRKWIILALGVLALLLIASRGGKK
ncbi:MAG: hypothetical protein QW607_09175 [Desulfurococcaceae archaeon]